MTNKLKQRERERVPILNATKQGFLWAYDGDGIDISPRMKYHRGTVQRGMSQTIKTSCDVGVIEIGHEQSDNPGICEQPTQSECCSGSGGGCSYYNGESRKDSKDNGNL